MVAEHREPAAALGAPVLAPAEGVLHGAGRLDGVAEDQRAVALEGVTLDHVVQDHQLERGRERGRERKGQGEGRGRRWEMEWGKKRRKRAERGVGRGAGSGAETKGRSDRKVRSSDDDSTEATY